MGRIQGDLMEWTFGFAAAILNLSEQLPNVQQGWVVGKQVIRSGTSIGANVREADSAFTDADFAYCCNIARKEACETHYWLQLCERTGMLAGEELDAAIGEADELVRILSTVVKATQQHIKANK